MADVSCAPQDKMTSVPSDSEYPAWDARIRSFSCMPTLGSMATYFVTFEWSR